MKENPGAMAADIMRVAKPHSLDNWQFASGCYHAILHGYVIKPQKIEKLRYLHGRYCGSPASEASP